MVKCNCFTHKCFNCVKKELEEKNKIKLED